MDWNSLQSSYYTCFRIFIEKYPEYQGKFDALKSDTQNNQDINRAMKDIKNDQKIQQDLNEFKDDEEFKRAMEELGSEISKMMEEQNKIRLKRNASTFQPNKSSEMKIEGKNFL